MCLLGVFSFMALSERLTIRNVFTFDVRGYSDVAGNVLRNTCVKVAFNHFGLPLDRFAVT